MPGMTEHIKATVIWHGLEYDARKVHMCPVSKLSLLCVAHDQSISDGIE